MRYQGIAEAALHEVRLCIISERYNRVFKEATFTIDSPVGLNCMHVST